MILIEKLSRVSSEPGVYLMKDAADNIIYVGKARNLKKRLTSYFGISGQFDGKTVALIKQVSDFETIITGTEKEALILESNLIKHHRPRYNVILKDDKRYPSLRLDTKQPYPNLSIVRKTENNGALYFGPFSSAQAVRETLRIINKTFKLRKCKSQTFKNRVRPCLNYQMGLCLAPCCLDVDKSQYNEIVKEVIAFLKGKTPELIRKIKADMTAAAEARDYEAAAVLRDKMYALGKTIEKQISVTTDFKDRDVIGLAKSNEFSIITILFVRGGFILGSRHFRFKETMSTDAEMLGSFIKQYYETSNFVPKEIIVPILPEDSTLISDWLKSIKGTKVNILQPQRGEKALLLKMADQNAENELKEMIISIESDTDLLFRLSKVLQMDKIPRQIECLDNSNISGTEAVAGIVVFKDGKPDKRFYRKYKIKSVVKQNDYAYMAEVLKRRYKKAENSEHFPDLLMVDGGKGQLNIAVSVTKSLGLEDKFEVIGIAKKDEKKGETQDKIYKPGRTNPLNFGREGELLLFLQRVRDEAHRFAISFHRKRRAKKSMASILDTIPGVGKKRKVMLLKHFGSIKKIRAATLDEISAVPGINRTVAQAVQKALKT
ncbi:MAG: excinuclease ABC subunit UvrC [Desulfobacterales bacterium]|nr:excinuclease ABC subunit UvrC [Desulfobacterales bacterium]